MRRAPDLVIVKSLAERARSLLAILSLVATATPATASETEDVQARAGVSLDLNLPNKWLLDLEYRHRMVDNLSTHKGDYFALEPALRLSKHVTALANYRFADTTGGRSHRYGLGLEYEARFGEWRLGLRPMLQHRTTLADDDDTGGDKGTFLRTRLRLEHKLTRAVDLYASVEPYFVFGADYPVDNWRNTIGLQYELARNVGVDLSYTYRPDYAKSYNRTFHVVSLSLRFRAKPGGR